MTEVNKQFLVGEEADAEQQAIKSNGNRARFTPLKSGTSLLVKVVGLKDYFKFYSYGIFGQVDSFVAKNPSKKTANGYPIEDLTPWDKAFLYHKERSESWNDTHGQEAQKYRPKARFAVAFYDLTEGKPIAVDLSVKQFESVKSSIDKYAKRIDKVAFELSKSGVGTNTVVSLSPVLDMEEDLTKEQRKNFENAPKEIDLTQFFSAPYVADEKEQIELLDKAGFDVTLIGYEKPTSGDQQYEF